MINYPVDVKNTRWAGYNTVSEEIVAHNKEWPNRFGLECTWEPNVVPLLEVQAVQPVSGVDYDPATHRLERSTPAVDVPNNIHLHGWVIVARSQEDLDNQAEREQAKAKYDDLKAGVGTQGERLVRVEKVAAHLLKVQYNL